MTVGLGWSPRAVLDELQRWGGHRHGLRCSHGGARMQWGSARIWAMGRPPLARGIDSRRPSQRATAANPCPAGPGGRGPGSGWATCGRRSGRLSHADRRWPGLRSDPQRRRHLTGAPSASAPNRAWGPAPIRGAGRTAENAPPLSGGAAGNPLGSRAEPRTATPTRRCPHARLRGSNAPRRRSLRSLPSPSPRAGTTTVRTTTRRPTRIGPRPPRRRPPPSERSQDRWTSPAASRRCAWMGRPSACWTWPASSSPRPAGRVSAAARSRSRSPAAG